jgi:glycine/D-amino acid oxidase-like deaminating enzyme
LLGTPAYRAGILDRRGGTLNPLAFTRGLAAAALRAGAAIHVGVDVRRLVCEPAGWRVVTGRGSVSAATVIAATNAYTGALLPGLRHPVVVVYGVQSATLPLPPALAHILPHGHGFSDVRKMFFRRAASDRLVVGGPGGVWPPSSAGAVAFRWLEHRLRAVFPELRDVPFQHRWVAKGAAALDLLPHLYEPAPGLFAALGFAGRGIAMGTALGSLLARRVQGEPAERLPFPTTTSRWPFGLGAVT